jgi:hypothetical protein
MDAEETVLHRAEKKLPRQWFRHLAATYDGWTMASQSISVVTSW